MTDSKKPGQLFEEARTAFGERRWYRAIDLLTEIMRIDASYPNAHDLLIKAQKRKVAESKYEEGLKYHEEKNWAKAIEVFEEVLRNDPDHNDAQTKLEEAKCKAQINRLLDKAAEYKRRRKWRQMIKILDRVLVLDPSLEQAKRQLDEAKQQKNSKKKKGTERHWFVWFLLGLMVAGTIFLLKQPIHCLLEYKLNEVLYTMLAALFVFITGYFSGFISDDIKKKVLWPFFAGAALSLLVFLLLVLFSPTPSKEECPWIEAIKPTPVTALPTATFTPSPSLIHTSTPTLVASPTPTRTPTATLTLSSEPTITLVVTLVPSPTLTVTPTLILTQSPTPITTITSVPSDNTPSPTPTPLPTSTPTPEPALAPAPILNEPTEGKTYVGQVTFNWVWFLTPSDEGPFEGDWFAVRVWPKDKEEEKRSITWVKNASYTWSPDWARYPSGEYCSNVAVVRQTGIPRDKNWEYVSLESNEVCFTVKEPSQTSPTATPTDIW
jgi:hypothetical protein